MYLQATVLQAHRRMCDTDCVA